MEGPQARNHTRAIPRVVHVEAEGWDFRAWQDGLLVGGEVDVGEELDESTSLELARKCSHEFGLQIYNLCFPKCI